MTASIWNPGAGIVDYDAESTNKGEVFTSTLGQTVFTLTLFTYTPATDSIAVYRNGQKLIKSVDFVETSSTVVTLTGISLVAGEKIEVVVVIGATGPNVLAAQTAAANAALSETNALNSANAAALSETNTATSASNAATSENNAGLSAISASTSASTATTQAGIATTQAGIATTQAGIATTKAGEAATDADDAEIARAAAVVAQVAAEAALAATLTAYDNFDDRYLGAKTSDPTVDNDGNPLVAGSLYYYQDLVAPINSTMKVYTGTVWVAAYVAGTDFLARANNLSDLTNTGQARTNLGLVIGTTVQAYDANLTTWAGKTAPSGTAVGTTDTQTLTNKTVEDALFTNGYTEETHAPAAGSSFTFDFANGTIQGYTTNANTTITLPSATAGRSFSIQIAYGGAHALTWAGGTIAWAGGNAPTFSGASGKTDTVSFMANVAGTKWIGTVFALGSTT